jgi:hypothetical protein
MELKENGKISEVASIQVKTINPKANNPDIRKFLTIVLELMTMKIVLLNHIA